MDPVSQIDNDRFPNGSETPLLAPSLPAVSENNAMFHCTIYKNTPEELLCIGYRRSWWKTLLVVIGTFFSVGFLMLVFYWRPDWKLKCTHTKTNFANVTAVSLTLVDTNEVFVSYIDLMNQEMANLMSQAYPEYEVSNLRSGSHGTKEENVKFFKHHDTLFVWARFDHAFRPLKSLDCRATLAQIHQNATCGLSDLEKENRKSLFGENVITVKIPSYFYLMVSEILNPFYIFQLFAVIFWCFDKYYVYATSIFVISIISAIASLIQVRRERVSLHDMVKYHNEIKMTVLRRDPHGNRPDDVWGKDLVPGDVIVIPPHGAQLACDVALVSGTCIVNESMLTGESVPITKTPLPSNDNEMRQIYSAQAHKRHTLFCGTEVLQTRFYPGEDVKGVVVRTGYHTAKGQLVHSILYPKPVDMQLLRDAYRFIGVLFFIAMCGFIYTVIIEVNNNASPRTIFFDSVDLITISVPPALPLAMTIGIIYAQLRLKKQGIHCISPQRINISGQVDVVAFDKTGTLTEDGLDLHLLLPVNLAPLDNVDKGVSPTFMAEVEPDKMEQLLKPDSSMLACMATCHTLTIINGVLTGDPLELKMFEATGWDLIEPKVEDAAKYDQLQTTYVTPKVKKEQTLVVVEDDAVSGSDELASMSRDIGILRQFPFTSSLQRASVIVKPMSSAQRDMVVYVKGAPETVAKLCVRHSVPGDFNQVLRTYTKQGYRMIGMATKALTTTWKKAQKIERSVVESDLQFVGLMALRNQLKSGSYKAHAKLYDANIRTLMVTGDNILTSLSVARECGMIGPSEDVLLAHTTPPNGTTPATLRWESSEGFTRNSSNRNSSTSSPSISGDEIIPHGHTSIAMKPSLNWHLAISGPDLTIVRTHFPEWVEVLATKGTVFARMSPQQKTDLMEDLEEVGYHVCMCGDGANDCGALKRAHTGISLSEYEASVAAPFTSHTEYGIDCVPTLIREGRAALVTSFGMFKFMALYSLIQFCSITILYNDESSFSDLEFLYVDLIIIDLVAITMSRNHAHKQLHPKRPLASLVSPEMLCSLVFQLLLQLAFQLTVFFLVKEQCWYTELPPAEVNNSTFNGTSIASCPPLARVPDQSQVENEDNVILYETSAIFFLSCFLYLSVSVAFSRGKPFRTAFYRNYGFVFSLLLLVGFTAFLMFAAPLPLADFMQFRVIPDAIFITYILLLALGHFIVSVSFEVFFIEKPKIWSKIKGLSLFRGVSKATQKRHKVVLQHLSCPVAPIDVTVSVGDANLPPFPQVGHVYRAAKMDEVKQSPYLHKTHL